MDKDCWLQQIDYISKFFKETTGFSFYFETDEESRAELYTESIYVNSRLHPEKKFYTALHEIGHVIIYENSDQFDRDYPMYVNPENYRNWGSKKHRVSVVAEEIEAWKHGRQLARDLDLFIDDLKYDKLMTECVMSYLVWAAA